MKNMISSFYNKKNIKNDSIPKITLDDTLGGRLNNIRNAGQPIKKTTKKNDSTG